MKTPEEIKKGLECCTAECDACGECPYPMEWGCRIKLMEDVLTRMRLLETDNSCLNNTIRCLTKMLNAAHEETAKVKRERDSAVSDIKRAQGCICNICKSYYRPDPAIRHYECKVFGKFSEIYENDDERPFVCGKFEWRGVRPENTEAQE